MTVPKAVARSGDAFVVGVRLLAEAFGLTEDEVRDRMRAGTITSRTEKGVGEDEGRWRLTFHHGPHAFRLVVDARGTILTQARYPVRPREAAARSGGV